MRTGDVLLDVGTGVISVCIQVLTGSEYTHARLLQKRTSPWAGIEAGVDVLEVREFIGARAVNLANVVDQSRGRIDWYRLDPHDRWPGIQRNAIGRKARQWTGKRYGYLTVLLAALIHMPFVRWLTRRDTGDSLNWKIFPDCSAFVSGCLQYGGIDPVPNMSHRYVEPGHLANSLALEYAGTLTP
jgi:hypothetical protein